MAEITKPAEPYSSYTMKQLRPYLKARGLRVTGRKPDRLADLEKWDAAYDQQQQQHVQQSEESNDHILATYIDNINAELGREAIDTEIQDHLMEQHVSVAMFEDLCINYHPSLQSTFGIDLGAVWAVRQKVLAQQKPDVSNDKPDAKEQKNDVKTASGKATDEQMALYEKRIRFLCIGNTVEGKATGIKTQSLRSFIQRKTQSIQFGNARSDKGSANAMKAALLDLDENFLIELTVNSLDFAGNGGTRHWTGTYDINKLSVKHPSLNAAEKEQFATYVKEKQIDLRNMAMVYGITELQAITQIGLLDLLN